MSENTDPKALMMEDLAHTVAQFHAEMAEIVRDLAGGTARYGDSIPIDVARQKLAPLNLHWVKSQMYKEDSIVVSGVNNAVAFLMLNASGEIVTISMFRYAASIYPALRAVSVTPPVAP